MTDENTEHEHQSNGQALAPVAPNQVARRDFGGTSLARENQATAALVAKAKADIEARFIMAMHRPRNWDQVRAMLIRECRRPGFADAAIYAKPIGNGPPIEGLSIRFAEVAARCMGNVAIDQAQIYDDETTRVIRISVTDLESNVTWPTDITVEKTVERKQLRRGQRPLGERVNSYGDQVYIVEANDDQVMTKQAALISKAVRTLILRIVPGHLQDEAMHVCQTVLADKASKDPDAEKTAMIDAFASFGVTPLDLEEWLGHTLDKITPAEITLAKGLYRALRDGETTWSDALDTAKDARPARKTAAPPADKAAKPKAATTAPSSEPPAPAQAPKVGGKGSEKLKGAVKPPKAEEAKTKAEPAPDIKPAPAAAKPEPKPEPVKPADPEAEPGWMSGERDEHEDEEQREPDVQGPPEGFEERACASCGVPIDVEIGSPAGSVCYACSQS